MSIVSFWLHFTSASIDRHFTSSPGSPLPQPFKPLATPKKVVFPQSCKMLGESDGNQPFRSSVVDSFRRFVCGNATH